MCRETCYMCRRNMFLGARRFDLGSHIPTRVSLTPARAPRPGLEISRDVQVRVRITATCARFIIKCSCITCLGETCLNWPSTLISCWIVTTYHDIPEPRIQVSHPFVSMHRYRVSFVSRTVSFSPLVLDVY